MGNREIGQGRGIHRQWHERDIVVLADFAEGVVRIDLYGQRQVDTRQIGLPGRFFGHGTAGRYINCQCGNLHWCSRLINEDPDRYTVGIGCAAIGDLDSDLHILNDIRRTGAGNYISSLNLEIVGNLGEQGLGSTIVVLVRFG